ncbi:hypothetical protein [Marivita sp.]
MFERDLLNELFHGDTRQRAADTKLINQTSDCQAIVRSYLYGQH